MPVEPKRDDEPRTPTEKWRRLPGRIDPAEMIASVPEDPAPSTPPAAGDPDTASMRRTWIGPY